MKFQKYCRSYRTTVKLGAEKLRDDITCMAINIKNTELIKKINNRPTKPIMDIF